ncbi:uncharacterized protein LOC131644536 [Vicia villosa]|uniref:uncharacterized protein LOC131644536 n=1 Tax=Vicia villosa TaxID=3911 RepID=UPI00273B08A8|nr:uncharacterized protein LOC131644536 [Vicia villosa]
MVGDGSKRDDSLLLINNTNVFSALDTLKKKKSDSKVFWAMEPLNATSWGDVDDDDYYYATTASPQFVWPVSEPQGSEDKQDNFEADVTMRYTKWWRQSALGREDFVKNIVKRKRSATSRKHRSHAGTFSKSGVHLGFPSVSVEECEPVSKEYNCGGIIYEHKHFEKDLKDENGIKEANVSSDIIVLSDSEYESKSYAIRNKVSLSSLEFDVLISSNVGGELSECGVEDEIKSPFSEINVNEINKKSVRSFTMDMEFDLENMIQKLKRVISKLKEARFGHKVEIV